MKYEGLSYPEIAKITGVPVDTIKEWFRSGGILVEGYNDYRDEQNEFANAEAKQSIKKNVKTAADMLVALMASTDDSVKFKAVKEILDRELGKPKDQDGDNLWGGDLSYERILAKARAKRNKPAPEDS